MSDITFCTRETMESIPFPCDNWSLHQYVSSVVDNYKFAEKKEAHRTFYSVLHNINNNLCMSQEVRDIAQNLIKSSKPDACTYYHALVGVLQVLKWADVESVNSLWRKNIKERKRQRESASTNSSSKKQCVVPEISCFCPSVDVPLQANGSVDILETVKSTICVFDRKIISLGSSRSYKSSNHLLVDSEQNVKVPRESTYDAEMYRILVNWLAIVNGFEITGQWHLEKVCDDGDYHHFYCDLTIKKPDNPHPEAVLELVATGTIPKLIKHFDRVIKYADQLCPKEVWIVHFSSEDSVASDPYWPSKKLQDRGLNVVHFWHDQGFSNIRMSARFRNFTGEFCEIINEQILP
ncbi:7051_t:CDS:2 [Funneliformis mosseae]|uniref:7051_t:CDS:1 n=1 Tax=Funneliformis mosseae TaxID=27381 RepID=A0A9N8ZID9_FUNMO|nr:7051_t:CDS:2 [Funneliformis mosseae]